MRQTGQSIAPLLSQFPAGLEFGIHLCGQPYHFVFVCVVRGLKAMGHGATLSLARPRRGVSTASCGVYNVRRSDQIAFGVESRVDCFPVLTLMIRESIVM